MRGYFLISSSIGCLNLGGGMNRQAINILRVILIMGVIFTGCIFDTEDMENSSGSQEENQAPEFTTSPSEMRDSITAGKEYLDTIQITEPDGDELTISVISGPSFTINDSVISWITSEGDTGTHQCSLCVTDSNGGNDTLIWNIIVSLSGSDSDEEIDPSEWVWKGNDLLLENAEDRNDQNAMGGYWYTYVDTSDGGGSIVGYSTDDSGNIKLDGEGYQGSEASFHISYKLIKGDNTYDPYIGFGTTLPDTSFDLSDFSGITYFHKGAAHNIRVEINAVEDYAHFAKTVPESDTWQEVKVPFSGLEQPSWGDSVAFDPTDVKNISWEINNGDGDSGNVWIDNIWFRDTIVIEKEYNMPIRPADPPEPEELSDLTISNPLQEQALNTLSKGINFTNWLEQGDFNGFEHDQAEINSLSSQGFQSIRLPIDLDRYIMNRDDYLSGDSAFAINDSLLFTILDSLVSWCQSAEMSLTVDFHQYDEGLDVGDSLYCAGISRIWKAIAQHYTEIPYTDLYLELGNEPKQAAGESVDQDAWRSFANQMIDSIRSVDEGRILLFGEVQWYDISALTDRSPLEDENIIYVFHHYEPFIFTHQSATWAGLGSVENVPFPYDSSKWSTEFSDFGFSEGELENWQEDLVLNYYKTGNKNHIKNEMIEAKRWAVENNVPVICNEFGAYEKGCDSTSMINYLRAVRESFEELEIPWQIWFGATTGGILKPGAGEALNLN